MAYSNPQSEDQFIAQAVQTAFGVNQELSKAGRGDECLSSLAELAIFVDTKLKKAERPAHFPEQEFFEEGHTSLLARFVKLSYVDGRVIGWLNSLQRADSTLDASKTTLDRTDDTALSGVMQAVAEWDGEGDIPEGLLRRRRDTNAEWLLDVSAVTDDTGGDVSIGVGGAGAGAGGHDSESKLGPIEPVTWHQLAITLYEQRDQLGIVNFQMLADEAFDLLEPTRVTELFNWVDDGGGGDEYEALPSPRFVYKLQESLLQTPLLGEEDGDRRLAISQWLGEFSEFPIGDAPSELHDGTPAAPTPPRRVRVRARQSRGVMPPRTRRGSVHPRFSQSTPEQMALAVSTNPTDPLRKLLSQESPGSYPGALSVLLSLPVTLNQAGNRTELKWHIDTYVGSMMRGGAPNPLTPDQLLHLVFAVCHSDARWPYLIQAVQAGGKTLVPLKPGEKYVLAVQGARAPLCAYIQISLQDRWRKWGAVAAFCLMGGAIAVATGVLLPKAPVHWQDAGPWSPLDALILLLFNVAGLPLGQAGAILFDELALMHGLQRVLQRDFRLTDGASRDTGCTSRGLLAYSVISHPLTHFALVTAFNLMVSLNWATHGGTDNSKSNIHEGVEAAWIIATCSTVLTALTWGGLRSHTRQTGDSAVVGYFKEMGNMIGRGAHFVATNLWDTMRCRRPRSCGNARTAGTGGGSSSEYAPMD